MQDCVIIHCYCVLLLKLLVTLRSTCTTTVNGCGSFIVVVVSAVEMSLTLLLLPLLLPESAFVVKSDRPGRKRPVWKPTVVETMDHFVDVQQVVMFLLIMEAMSKFSYSHT